MTANETITIKCVEVTQPIGTFYIGVMEAKDLIRISYADIRRLDRDLDDYLGIQRKLSPKRVEELQKYVDTIDATFPTSVILAVSSDHVSFNKETNSLEITADEEVAKIIDGQHRIKGLEGFSEKIFQLNVTIFIDMDIEDQAMVFATINLAQTKVNRSLVYDLYEHTESRSPQKTAHNIARLLNSTEKSPFENRIKILGTATPGVKGETLTQATFVEALIKLISGNSQRALEDRELLKRGKKPARASSAEAYSLVFRNMFLDNKEAEIAKVIWNYFSAVSSRWTESWKNNNVTGNILPRSTGFSALMRLLPTLYNKLGGAGTIPSSSKFLDLFQRVEINDGEFTRENFLPGSAGQGTLFAKLEESLKP